MAKPYRSAKTRPKANWRPKQFRALIVNHGSNVLWEKSSTCPCVEFVSDGDTDTDTDKQPSGEPQSDCAECYGKGIIYREPTEVEALVLGGSRIPLFQQIYGDRAKGMANITVFPEVMAREWDRFTVLNSYVRMSEDRVRTGLTERMRYPIVSKHMLMGEEIDPTNLVEVDDFGIYLRRADSVGTIVETPLVEDEDYTIDTDGQLVWSLAGTLASGVFIASGDFVNGTVIPAGTELPGNGVQTPAPGYVTTSDAIAYDGVAIVAATANAIGTAYNIIAGTKIITTILGVAVEAEAMALFTGGTAAGVGGNIPAVGERFSITYFANPAYIVQDMPHLHRDTNDSSKTSGSVGTRTHLPLQLHCWLEHLGPPHGYAVS